MSECHLSRILWQRNWWQWAPPIRDEPLGCDGILLASLDSIWQFCNIKICSFASSSGTSGEEKKVVSESCSACRTPRPSKHSAFPSLAIAHTQCIYPFSPGKRTTFGIAQAAELIIQTPWGHFKLQAKPPRMIWNQHNHQPEWGSPCSLSSVGGGGAQICRPSNFLSLFRTSVPRVKMCQDFSESVALTITEKNNIVL